MSDTNILHADENFAMATVDDTFVIIWRRETTMAAAKAVAVETAAFARGRPKGIVLLTVVEEHAPPPPAEVRARIATFLRESSDVIRASALVYEGSSVRAAVVRSVVLSMMVLARQRYPHKVFSTLREGAAFLDRAAGASLAVRSSAASLTEAVTQIRAELDRR